MRRELVIYLDTTEETEASIRMSSNKGFVLFTYEGVKFELSLKEVKTALNDLEDFEEGNPIDRTHETKQPSLFDFNPHNIEFKTDEEFQKENS